MVGVEVVVVVVVGVVVGVVVVVEVVVGVVVEVVVGVEVVVVVEVVVGVVVGVEVGVGAEVGVVMTDTPPLDLDRWEAEAKERLGFFKSFRKIAPNFPLFKQDVQILNLISALRSEAEAHKWQAAECEKLKERLASAEEALKFYSHEGDFSFAPDIARAHFEKWGKK